MPIERGSIYLPKDRYSHTVIWPNSGDGDLLRDREPIVLLDRGARNLFCAYRIAACENVLAIVPNSQHYLPIERGRMGQKIEVTRRLCAQIAETGPIAGSGAYCSLR